MFLYGKTKKSLALVDKEHILDLQVMLDIRIELLVRKEIQVLVQSGEEDKKPLEVDNGMSWALPSHLVLFLENSIKKIEKIRLQL